LDSLAFGVLLAYWRVFWPETLSGWVRPLRGWLVLGGLLCLAPAFVLPLETSWWIRTFGFTLNYLGAGALLLVGVGSGEDRAPSRLLTGAAWLGAASYPIYLWHMDIIWQFHARLHLAWGWSVWSTAGASLVASLLVGVAVGRLVEWPVLRWRDRAFPSRAGAATAATAAHPS
jgi:peptidoglycan/LPS O-acetylase OafA/YrhL